MSHLKAEVCFGNLTAMLPLKSVTILGMTSESAYVSAWLEAVTTHWNLLVLEMDMLVHLQGMKHEAPALEFKRCSHEERKRWLQWGKLGQWGVRGFGSFACRLLKAGCGIFWWFKKILCFKIEVYIGGYRALPDLYTVKDTEFFLSKESWEYSFLGRGNELLTN